MMVCEKRYLEAQIRTQSIYLNNNIKLFYFILGRAKQTTLEFFQLTKGCL